MKTQIVKFNVGGRKYEVARSLLESYPDTMLAKSVSHRWQENHPNEEVYIEGNGDRFGYCLDYLRDGRCYLPWTVSKNAVIRDLEYYCLDVIDEEFVIEAASQYLDLKLSGVCKRLTIITEKIDSLKSKQPQSIETNEITQRKELSTWIRYNPGRLGILFFILATVKVILNHTDRPYFDLSWFFKAQMWLETILLLLFSVKVEIDPMVGVRNTVLLKILSVTATTLIIIVTENHKMPLHVSLMKGLISWCVSYILLTVFYYHGIIQKTAIL